MDIKSIKNPNFLKDLNIEELNNLANDIRSFLIENVSKTGGHLSSNLGVVELTIALHYVFDAPQDKLLFDVGHQSYVHKILTGRADQMESLRQYKGLAGFQKRNESIYDCFEAGHSSTALSTALGMAVSRDLNNEDYCVVPIVGDASMMSGLSLEALNQIGDLKNKMIIIFNDNKMSINANVGSLSKAFSRLRNNTTYNNIKFNVKDNLKNKEYGDAIISFVHGFKDKITNSIVDRGIFDEFGIYYLGPIDGHNIEELINILKIAKKKEYPVVIHCVTKKGKGYKYTENDDAGLWHGVGKFDIETGKPINSQIEGYKSTSKIVADTIKNMMEDNQDIVAITPAMKIGSCLDEIFNQYPDRAFDCGIAEDHGVCFASGLALSNKRPFVSIYSSFAQRAYDQFNHDIARMDLPVVFGIDRASLVGEDGETHHGVYDIAMFRSLPNLIISQGKDAKEMKNLLYTAFNQKHPFILRYNKESLYDDDKYQYDLLNIGSWTYLNEIKNPACYILSYGSDVDKINQYVLDNNLNYQVVNCRFIKPIDTDILDTIINNNKPMFIYTVDIIKGGLGDDILEYLNTKDAHNHVDIIGIDDEYIKHGSVELLKQEKHLDLNHLFNKIKNYLS